MTQSSCKREVIPVWNLRRREFSHVNIPLVSRSTLRHHKSFRDAKWNLPITTYTYNNYKGYPTAEFFQIRQKCLKWFSPGFRSLFS